MFSYLQFIQIWYR